MTGGDKECFPGPLRLAWPGRGCVWETNCGGGGPAGPEAARGAVALPAVVEVAALGLATGSGRGEECGRGSCDVRLARCGRLPGAAHRAAQGGWLFLVRRARTGDARSLLLLSLWSPQV